MRECYVRPLDYARGDKAEYLSCRGVFEHSEESPARTGRCFTDVQHDKKKSCGHPVKSVSSVCHLIHDAKRVYMCCPYGDLCKNEVQLQNCTNLLPGQTFLAGILFPGSFRGMLAKLLRPQSAAAIFLTPARRLRNDLSRLVVMRS